VSEDLRYPNDASTWVFAHSQDNGFDAVMRRHSDIVDPVELEWAHRDTVAFPDGGDYWDLGATRAFQILRERLLRRLEDEWRAEPFQALYASYKGLRDHVRRWETSREQASSEAQYWACRSGEGSRRNRLEAEERRERCEREILLLTEVVTRLAKIIHDKGGRTF